MRGSGGGFAFLFGGGKACESLTACQTSFRLDLSLRRVECRTIGCEFGFQNLSTGVFRYWIWNLECVQFRTSFEPGRLLRCALLCYYSSTHGRAGGIWDGLLLLHPVKISENLIYFISTMFSRSQEVGEVKRLVALWAGWRQGIRTVVVSF